MTNDGPPKQKVEPVIPLKKSETVAVSRLKPQYHKTFLKDLNDVEEYVQIFKVALITELEKGNSLLV